MIAPVPVHCFSITYVIRAHVCVCWLDALPLFLGVLFNRYFLCFYATGVNTFVIFVLTSLYSYSLCTDVYYSKKVLQQQIFTKIYKYHFLLSTPNRNFKFDTA